MLFAISRKSYVYTCKGGNTSSMIAHLRDKYGITKDNFTNYLDEYREPKWDQSHQIQVTDYYSSLKLCPAKRQEFLQEVVKLLELIKIVTRHLCGANYSILNLVHPYMESLKKKFAPRSDKNETVDIYLNLVYGKGYEENDDDEMTDDDIPDTGIRQQWQYAHCQFHQRMSAHG
ncbi:hypothetical protein C1646_675606 [Rhizophagus diaphanus]|nr:hypothetical protein C1646_675606 [Rhizophagus diaphanus] [Rhizophagus sp. MUCL 43196]